MLSKYPPIEGGVSAETYWTAKHLGKKGLRPIVVSNCWSEEVYKENIESEELYLLQPPNGALYSTNPLTSDKTINEETSLLALGIEVNEKEKPDLWYSHYLFPYGIVAWALAQKTKKSLIIRHAGSDMARLRTSSYVSLIHLLKDADLIISGSEEMKEISKKVAKISRVIPPEFNPSVKPLFESDVPTIGVIGKLNPYKKVEELIKTLNEIESKHSVFVLCDKEGELRLRSNIRESQTKNIMFSSFLPPWKMPQVYRSLDIVYCGEKDFPVAYHFSAVPLEAMACGTCTLVSDEIYMKYCDLYQLENFKNTVMCNTSNPESIKEGLEYLLNNDSERKRIAKEGRMTIINSLPEYSNIIDYLAKLFEMMI